MGANNKAVWVVDDSEEMRSLYSDFLKAMGFEVTSYSNGKDALEKLKELGDQHNIGAIVSDVCMQPINGFEVLKSIRQQDPTLPVVLMSSFPVSDTEIRKTGYAANSFLQKPFPLNSLASVIHSAMKTAA